MKNFGLVGKKLSHSYSPELHKIIMEDMNVNGRYSLIECEKIDDETIEFLKENFDGFNITIPYKESFFKYLDYLDEKAEKIGAINTILIRDNKLYGYNTDYEGVRVMLRDIELKNKICYVLGSGGGAKGVISFLQDSGAKIFVVSRSKKVFKDIKTISYSEIKKGDIVINTTPLGMYPDVDSVAINQNILINFKVAVDIVYNPRETKFLKIAKQMGLKTYGGIDMLIAQAIYSEIIWNNI